MRARALIGAVMMILMGGCNQQDTSKESSDAAEKRVKLGDYKGAIELYESALDGSKKTADLHYKIAVLYDDKLKEPLDAIHHYGRYQELLPGGSHAKEVKDAKSDCEKRLQTRITQGGFMSLSEGARLKNENESLRKTIADMRSPKAVPGSKTADPNAKDLMPPGSREHTVVKGDTLASIALKYYKNRSYSSQLKDANFNQLGGKDSIKPGQVLIIPEMAKAKKKK